MKRIFLLLVFSTLLVSAQSRNTTVRQLNSIIDFMDESSRINRTLYWDIKQFSEGYIHSSRPKRNDNYWWTQSRKDGRVGPFDKDKGRFLELHVDDEGMVSDFEFELYPVLVERENIDKLLAGKFFNDKPDIKKSLLDFKSMMDSLIVLHRTLYEYVGAKTYLNDTEFKTALSIIDQTSKILDSYYDRAKILTTSIETYYKTLPVLKTQKKITTALIELDQCKDHINKWADELYGGINNTSTNDQILHSLNDVSLAKDSILLFSTYGYGVENNGAMPHTRYTIFYGMMKSTLYWYAKDKFQYPKFMTKRDVDYNEFVDRIHMDVEDYNDFIECADGKQLSENMDYSMKMAAGIGVDTNQNVQLKWPRKSYLFHFVKPEDEKHDETVTINEVKTDTAVVTVHQQMINNSLPHHMVFLLDISASMHDPGKLDLLKGGAKYLVSLQRNKDHISLLTFSTHSHTLLRNVACDQKENIYKKIEELQAKGASNASDGIRNSFGIADSNKLTDGKNKIILVTDGKFQLDASATKLLGSFKKKNIELIIFLVGKDDPTIEKDFGKIAKKGNGRFYKVDAKTLEDILVKEASD